MKSKIVFLILSFSLAQYLAYSQTDNKTKELKTNPTFVLPDFESPAKEYAPYARWWWPGNDVTSEELIREIDLFADHGFGGVEVQPLNIGIPISRETSQKVLSWGTPEYYNHLKVVLEESRKKGLKIDLTNGSGWPPGGSYLDAEDGFLSLNHADTLVLGGQSITIVLPKPINKTSIKSRLQAVVAAKALQKKEGDNSATVLLDSSSSQVLTTQVKNNVLTWNVPEGTWKIIVFWAIPSGENTNIAALPKQGPVVDHLDSVKVLKNYNHLLGERTGLSPYFGNPLRAVFNDSYEFKANRHYSPDFIAWFKKHRGYDIVPWLPANMQNGYNMVEFMNPHAEPDYKFSGEDWRLRYDYDLTIGELLGEHFFKTSKNFMEVKGLLHRTQPYGLNMDMMAMAGMASIPETESMLGSEAKLKLITSGAQLYNKPIVSSESVVFINKAYATTPQIIRVAVNKLFAAGVNQIIYHGIPYRFTPDKIAKEGWYPFSISFLPFINFSSNLGESNPYWKYQKEINNYVARTQYALRTGKPATDVLIYYPFVNFSGFADNPDEILTKGSLDKTNSENEDPKDPQAKLIKAWSQKIWPLINELQKNGITWGWVNDASLQVADLTAEKQINIRGNLFQGLILSDVPYMQMKTAGQISKLASLGLKLLISGNIPNKQPSFLNWQENDKKTEAYLASALASPESKQIKSAVEISGWISTIKEKCPVRFDGNYSFTRQVQRDLPDGSRIQFIWNKSDQWQSVSLSLDNNYAESYWLNAEDGSVVKNATKGKATYKIPPYSSIILFAATQKMNFKNIGSIPELYPGAARKVLTIDQWDIQADSINVKNSKLFDWKMKEDWKYSSAVGVYKSSFKIESVDRKKNYLLDLGQVNYSAELYINDQHVGTRLYAPFLFEIGKYIRKGDNTIEIRVTPTLLNNFIGNARSDKKYKQFKDKESELMPEGLVGPVVILEK